MEPLPVSFFERAPRVVAAALIGALLIFHEKIVRIVETEAYHGPEDPASRAALNGRKGRFAIMWERPGLSLVYNVHRYWMFNVVAHEKGKVGAILIRAGEPINIAADLSGPGKLTRALGITPLYHGRDLTIKDDIYLAAPEEKQKITIGISYRIGIKRDLPIPCRFFDIKSKAVSRHKRAIREIEILWGNVGDML